MLLLNFYWLKVMFTWSVAREHHCKRHEFSFLCIFPWFIFLLLAKKVLLSTLCLDSTSHKNISTSWAPSCHTAVTLFAQFSAHREWIIFEREACLAISCEPPPLFKKKWKQNKNKVMWKVWHHGKGN